MQRVSVIGANRWGTVLSLVVSAIAITAMVGGIASGSVHGKEGVSFLNVMMMLAIGGGAGAWMFSRFSRRNTGLEGELTADDDEIRVNGQRVARRAQISKAYVVPTRDAAVVRLERGFRSPIDLAVSSVEAGRALLQSIGLDASRVATELSILSVSRKAYRRRYFIGMSSVIPMLGSMMGAGFARRAWGLPPWAVGTTILLGMLFYFVMMLQTFKRTRMIIGADGIDLQWLWQKKFIPMKDIVSAEVIEGEMQNSMFPIFVRLNMRNGAPIDLYSDMGRGSIFGTDSSFNRFARARAAITAERINEVVAARPPVTSWNTTALLREGRSVADWVAALRTLKERVQTFREDSALDQLWGVLEDANAGPEERAAAAVALAPDLDDKGRERIRVAARATGAPKLRVALEAAAHDDEDKLVEALGEVAEKA